ncbi:MAG TPA: DUF5985 family protein [Gemmatimonadaceae bacterium]|nr:DUF5985 family protein [Gemmatimonadaceae bacterium]
MSLADIVYLLCAATSLLCTVLLWKGYRASHAPLLKWSAFCFGGLFLNNLLLVIDVRVGTSVDLALWRTIPALIGVGCLLYGLIRGSEEA